MNVFVRCMYVESYENYVAEYTLCVCVFVVKKNFKQLEKSPYLWFVNVCRASWGFCQIITPEYEKVGALSAILAPLFFLLKSNSIFGSWRQNLKGWFELVRRAHNFAVKGPSVLTLCISSLLGRRARSTNTATYRQCPGHGSSCRPTQSMFDDISNNCVFG